MSDNSKAVKYEKTAKKTDITENKNMSNTDKTNKDTKVSNSDNNAKVSSSQTAEKDSEITPTKKAPTKKPVTRSKTGKTASKTTAKSKANIQSNKTTKKPKKDNLELARTTVRLTLDNSEFLKIYTDYKNISQQEYINELIAKERKKNMKALEMIEEAKKILK